MTQSTKHGLGAYIALSLKGAFRLLCGDINGLNNFSPSNQAALLSFSSFLISLPIWLFMQLHWGISDQSLPHSQLAILLLNFGTHITSIFIIYLIVHRISHKIGRATYFPLYVTLQNWGMAVITVILLGLSFFTEVITLPPTALSIVQSFFVALQIGYTFYLTKISLNVSFWVAVGLVVLEIVVNMILTVMNLALVYGGQFTPDGTGFPAG